MPWSKFYNLRIIAAKPVLLQGGLIEGSLLLLLFFMCLLSFPGEEIFLSSESFTYGV